MQDTVLFLKLINDIDWTVSPPHDTNPLSTTPPSIHPMLSLLFYSLEECVLSRRQFLARKAPDDFICFVLKVPLTSFTRENYKVTSIPWERNWR